MAMVSGTKDIVTGDLEVMTFQYKAKQSGYESSEAALVFQSIKKRLPTMFSKLTANSSEYTLPGCPTFESFNTQDGESSFVDYQKREVKSTRTNLINSFLLLGVLCRAAGLGPTNLSPMLTLGGGGGGGIVLFVIVYLTSR